MCIRDRFWHKVQNRKTPLVRGFDDMFLAPHSRHTEVPAEDIHNCSELTVLAESEEAGVDVYKRQRRDMPLRWEAV